MDYKDIAKDIDKQIRELQKARKVIAELGGAVGKGRRRRRTMSAASRAKIAAAQRRRWSKLRLVKKRG